MKQRNLLTIFLLMLIGLSANAQINFGVKAEIGLSNAVADETYAISTENIVTYQLQFLNTSPTKSFGAFAQFESGPLFIQPEVMYSSSKNFYLVTNFIADAPIDVEITEIHETIDFNVVGGLKIQNFRLGVGPSFHVLAKHENELASMERFDIKNRNITSSFNFSLGYDIGRLTFDARYENAFSRTAENIFIEGAKTKLDSHPDRFSLAIGIKF